MEDYMIVLERVVQEGEMEDEKKRSTKNVNKCSYVFSDCFCIAIFYRTDKGDWIHALSYAYSSVVMWIFLRGTMGDVGRIYRSDASLYNYRYANDVSNCYLYGI